MLLGFTEKPAFKGGHEKLISRKDCLKGEWVGLDNLEI